MNSHKRKDWLPGHLRLAFCLLVILGGCHMRSSGSDPSVLFDVAIEDLDRNTTLRPGVLTTINGKPSAMIIDTGAAFHVHFIQKNELTSSNFNQSEVLLAQYFSGHSAVTMKQFDLKIGAFERSLPREGRAMVPPEVFFYSDSTLAPGLLSPQSLGGDITAILDFPNKRFVGIRGDSKKAQAWYHSQGNNHVFTPLKATSKKDHVFLVNASVQNHPPVTVLLDTGAFVTHFRKSYLQPSALLNEHVEVNDVWGNSYQTEAVADQTILLAGHSTKLSKVVLDGPLENESSAQGIIAMDVLQNAVLIVPYYSNDEIFISFGAAP